MPVHSGGKPRVFRCRARKAARASIAGQGFESLAFGDEQRIVNREHMKRG
jgi:hypothetical protein